MRMRFQVLLLAFGRMVFHTGTRMVYPFLSTFARGMGVDIEAISLAITIRASAGFLSPFLTALIERWDRKAGIQLGIAIFVIGNLIVVLWPTYLTFCIALSVGFLGIYAYISATQAYLGDRVAYRQRGLALGLTEGGFAMSFMIGMPIIAFLIGRFGWQSAFPFLVLTGLLLMGLIQWLLPAADPQGTENKKRLNARESLRMVFTSPAALTGLAMSFCITCANEIITLIFGVWIEDSFGLMLAALGGAAALIGVAELIGELGSGGILDRFGKKRTLFIGLLINALVALALPWLGRELWGALLALFLFYFSFEFAIVSDFTLMTGVLPAARGVLMGSNIAFISLGRMLGAMLAPILYRQGIVGNGIAALIIDLLAIIALWRLQVSETED